MGWTNIKRSEKDKRDEDETENSDGSDRDYERGRRSNAGASGQKKRRNDSSGRRIPSLGSLFGANEYRDLSTRTRSSKVRRDQHKKNRRQEGQWYSSPITSIRWGMVGSLSQLIASNLLLVHRVLLFGNSLVADFMIVIMASFADNK
jgi:hypothetical protein